MLLGNGVSDGALIRLAQLVRSAEHDEETGTVRESIQPQLKAVRLCHNTDGHARLLLDSSHLAVARQRHYISSARGVGSLLRQKLIFRSTQQFTVYAFRLTFASGMKVPL